MTIRQKMKETLEDNGMFPEQAEEVIKLSEQNETLASMKGRWDDSTEDYPPSIVTLTWITVKEDALKWIDANMPRAWYRPMFAE